MYTEPTKEISHMATSKEYLNFILDQLSALDGISARQMMGEYIIYFRGKIAAYVCDDRLLVKPVPAAVSFVKNPVFEPPYPGAKDMLLIEEVDSAPYLTDLFNAMYEELPLPKKKAQSLK